MVCIGLLVSVAAFARFRQAEATTGNTFTGRVQSVQDGDTIHLQQPILNTTEVRLVGIDAPETFTVEGHAPGNQIDPHGNASRDFLRRLLPHGTEITLVTDKFERFVGDFLTKTFVSPADYRSVPV